MALFICTGHISDNLGYLVWIIFICNLFIIILDKSLLNNSVPFLVLFAPLAGSVRCFGLLPSDIYVIVLAIILSIDIKINYQIKKNSYILFILLTIFLSFLFSFKYLELLGSMIRVLNIIIIYTIFKFYCKSSIDIKNFLKYLYISSFYMVLIIISGYVNAIRLETFLINGELNKIIVDNIDDFYRAGYFYTNFIYILGPGAVLSCYFYVSSTQRLTKLFIVILTAIFLFTCYIVYNKTMLCSLFISAFLVTLFYACKNRKIFIIFLLFFALCIVVYLVYNYLLGVDSNYSLNTGSMTARFIVFNAVLNYLHENILTLIFGYGPGAVLAVDDAQIKSLLWGGYVTEGAIDSTYISLLFEFGIIFLIFYIIYLLNIIKSGFTLLSVEPNKSSLLNYLVLTIIIFISVSGFSQVLGINKIAWIVVQIFALSEILFFKKYRPYLSG